MLALQILDSGQTFFQALEGRALVIGSAHDADIRLTESGVALHHARVEPIRRGDETVYKIVDLDSATGIRVNDVTVTQMLLSIGDRVEVGRAVLVLGQQVQRPAEPEDVLAPVVPRPGPRRVRRNGRGHGTRRVAVVAALILGIGAAVSAVLWSSGQGDGRLYLSQVERHRRAGRFDDARGELARLRARWGGDVDRLEQLKAETQRIADVERAVAERRQQLLVDASDTTHAELNRRLQEEERSAPEMAAREAARIVRGGLSQLLADVGHRGPGAPAPAERQEGAPDLPTPPAPAQPDAGVEPERDRTAATEVLADVDRLEGDGLFAQALETLRVGMGAAAPEDAGVLRQRLDSLRRRVRAEMQTLVDAAHLLEREGKLDEAVAHLAGHAHRFPTSGDLALLSHELETLRGHIAQREVGVRKAAAGGAELEQTRRVTLSVLQSLLDQIRQAELSGDFASATRLLRDGADAVAERDPRYAARLRDKAADFDLVAELSALVANALPKAGPVEVAMRDGRPASLTGTKGHELVAQHAEGDALLSWQDLPIPSVERLLDALKAPPRAWLGAAVLGYRGGDRERAEGFLARALRADRDLKEAVDLVITRGRRDRRDPRGYQLVKGQFVSAREIDAEQLARKLEGQLANVLRRDEAARAEFVEGVLAKGPEALDALLLALRRQHEDQVERLGRLSVKKQYDRLLARREELDAARKSALELIYDEKKYFYPFKPPAVSGEKHAEYNRVQQEIDRRIAAVGEIWDDERLVVRIPASAAKDLARLEWLTRLRAEFGETDPEVEAGVDWLRTLPQDGSRLTIRTFCYTNEERNQLAMWGRIEAYNQQVAEVMNPTERAQLAITNAYRRLFNHRPLALNPKIHEAARGHADEMSTLGYFAHRSPTPGRSTPFDRMRLAGYDFGVSENIALNGSAEGAHWAWRHSSGHHRNMLNPGHTEFGVGVNGRYYVQNFGRGEEFLQDERFPPASVR